MYNNYKEYNNYACIYNKLKKSVCISLYILNNLNLKYILLCSLSISYQE